MMGLFWKKGRWMHVPVSAFTLVSFTLMLASLRVMTTTISSTTGTWVDCHDYTNEQISKYTKLNEGAMLCAFNDPNRNGQDNQSAKTILERAGMMYAGIVLTLIAHLFTLCACTWHQRKMTNDQSMMYQRHVEQDAANTYA
jgi:hypothetical protein